jgi:hypothetical protein
VTAPTGSTSPIEGDGPPAGGLRARGFVIAGVELAVAVGFLWRAYDIREAGQPLDEGLVFWSIVFWWLLAGLLTTNIRSLRQRRLIREADESGGTLLEPPSPLLWPAAVLGIVWRTFLLLVPGVALWWYAVAANTDAGEHCDAGTGCITGGATWLPLAVILLVGGLVIAGFSARKTVKNAKRRLDGLPPEVLFDADGKPLAPAKVTIDRTQVAAVEAEPPSAPTQGSPAASAIDRRLARLSELADLHAQGVIDDAELERLKDEVLAEEH